MASKNILHLINSYEIGGLEKLVYYFIKNSDFSLFNLSVGALNRKGVLRKEFKSLGIPVHDFGLRPGLDLRVVSKISNVMKSLKIDILHTHNLGPHFYGSLAAFITNVPAKIHTEHGSSGSHRAGNLLKHRYLDRKSDVVVAVSPQVKTFIADKWKPRCKLTTILNGIEWQDNNDLYKDSGRYREMIKAKPQDRIIGHVGRLSQVKDQITLLRAFRILLTKFKDLHLVIVGGGPMYSYLENETEKLKISPHVHFMGERDDVLGFLSIFDVFVLSSLSEGISIALLEAMAHGVVPVVTAVGGSCEVVTDKVNGLLVPAGDVQKIAAQINIVLDKPEIRKKLSTQARETARSKFSIQRMVHDYEIIYKRFPGRGLKL